MIEKLRTLKRRLAGGCVVLYYHRVADLEADPQQVSLPPALFQAQIRALAARYAIVPLRQVVEAVEQGRRLRGRQLCITFDDGYADNLHNALPVLEETGSPATFFVSTGYVDHAREFWWDDLERLLLDGAALPDRLRIDWGGEPAAFATDSPAGRRALYRSLLPLLRTMEGPARNGRLDELRARIGLAEGPRASHRPLTADELRQLGRSPLADVGGHTVWHVCLASLPAAQQRDEIIAGKTRLEEILGRAVDLFSYPFGQAGDVSRETSALARAAGFRAAFTTSGATLRSPAADPFRLPRVRACAVSPARLLRAVQAAWDE